MVLYLAVARDNGIISSNLNANQFQTYPQIKCDKGASHSLSSLFARHCHRQYGQHSVLYLKGH